MTGLTNLEQAALRAIFAETPEFATTLERQLECATVTERENTGGGFFTTISVSEVAPRLNGPEVLGYETYARVEGLIYGLGFVVVMKDGRLHLLDGHSVGAEDTSPLDLERIDFSIARTFIEV